MCIYIWIPVVSAVDVHITFYYCWLLRIDPKSYFFLMLSILHDYHKIKFLKRKEKKTLIILWCLKILILKHIIVINECIWIFLILIDIKEKKKFDIDICEFQYIVVQMKFFAVEHKNLWVDSRYISAPE